MKKVCFLDRDGVLIEDRHYLSDPNDVKLIDGAAEAVKMLREAGYTIIVVTNQSGVARGYYSESSISTIHKKIDELLKTKDAYIDKYYYCPHHSDGEVAEFSFDCSCRKPKTGMIEQALQDYEIDLSKSIVIGDKLSDIKLSENAGCRLGILVKTGHGKKQAEKNTDDSLIVRENILDAAKWFLEHTKK